MTAASVSLVEDLNPGGTFGCQNCGSSNAQEFEISRLVQMDGDLHETPVVSFISCCEECIALISIGDWRGLASRKVA